MSLLVLTSMALRQWARHDTITYIHSRVNEVFAAVSFTPLNCFVPLFPCPRPRLRRWSHRGGAGQGNKDGGEQRQRQRQQQQWLRCVAPPCTALRWFRLRQTQHGLRAVPCCCWALTLLCSFSLFRKPEYVCACVCVYLSVFARRQRQKQSCLSFFLPFFSFSLFSRRREEFQVVCTEGPCPAPVWPGLFALVYFTGLAWLNLAGCPVCETRGTETENRRRTATCLPLRHFPVSARELSPALGAVAS